MVEAPVTADRCVKVRLVLAPFGRTRILIFFRVACVRLTDSHLSHIANNVLLPATDLGGAPKDLLAAIRKLEAQLAQEKFFHDKSRTEQQHEIKVKCDD